MSAGPGSELTCKELVELVTDHLEKQLSGARRARFERHLRACPGCRAYLSQMRALVRAARRLAREDPRPARREDLLAVFREWRRAPGGAPRSGRDRFPT